MQVKKTQPQIPKMLPTLRPCPLRTWGWVS